MAVTQLLSYFVRSAPAQTFNLRVELMGTNSSVCVLLQPIATPLNAIKGWPGKIHVVVSFSIASRGVATLCSALGCGISLTILPVPWNPFFILSSQQALVGLALGPDGTQALIEHNEIDYYPWRHREAVYLAVVLSNADDAVQIVQPPSPLCPMMTTVSPSGDASWWGAEFGGGSLGGVRNEEWLKCVRESMELMSASLNRELPATFVEKDLLPKVCGLLNVKLSRMVSLGATN